MANILKVLGQSNPPATTATTLYTVPAANSAVVSTLTVCNQSSSADFFRIAVRPTGATLDPKHYIAYNSVIPALDSISLTIGITLAATDVITVYAGTANLSFNLFGTEIT
jgi:hypothetical protein